MTCGSRRSADRASDVTWLIPSDTIFEHQEQGTRNQKNSQNNSEENLSITKKTHGEVSHAKKKRLLNTTELGYQKYLNI